LSQLQELVNFNTILTKSNKVILQHFLIGYYPPDPSKEYTEYSAGGKGDFFAELCTDWESAAKLSAEVGVRQVTIRSGVET